MCNALYVKANGELPCWDDVGEERILRRLSEEALVRGEEEALFSFPELVRIRRCFAEGRDPHPELCPGCAVRGHGRVVSERPRVMHVLHVEPSYLCHLACPQCIPPRLRRELKGPPYNMSPRFYAALLGQLQREGVAAIRFVHFEGRGDPLMNKGLGEMIRETRRRYPRAFTMVTTHGNFPYRPWLVESGLDVLRLAVDGAFPESYARYRVGGRLERVLALMRRIREEKRWHPSRLRVEWKYVLFEWNDSDEEIREAARLAEELDVRLRFCLTHAPGHSRRFRDMRSLRRVLAELAPHASEEITFQLKASTESSDVGSVMTEHAAALLDAALRYLEQGDRAGAARALREALARAPGIEVPAAEEDAGAIIAGRLPAILAAVRAPAVCSGLAALSLRLGDHGSAAALLERYLALAPGADDAAEVERRLRGIRAEARLARLAGRAGALELGELRVATREVLELLGVPTTDAGGTAAAGELDDSDLAALDAHPGVIERLANLYHEVRELGMAERLFRRYLALAGDAPDRGRVMETVAGIAAARALERAVALLGQWDGAGEAEVGGGGGEVSGLLRAALVHDPGREALDPLPGSLESCFGARFEEVLKAVRHPTTFSGLAALALAAGYRTQAIALYRRYLAGAPDARDVPRVREALESLVVAELLAASRRASEQGDSRAADRSLAEALAMDPGSDAWPSVAEGELMGLLSRHFDALRRCRFSATLSGLANVCLARREFALAERLFVLYLEREPGAPDRAAVEATLRRVRLARLLQPFKRLLS
jgi:molybdenum cofactor biosynthesis enzyme MoaA